MYQVGDRLVDIAMKSASLDEVDLFGRSAINRYYYACFLEVRKAVKTISPGTEIKHKQLPIHLRKKFAQYVRSEIYRLQSQGLISEGRAIAHRRRLNTLASDLANLLEYAYKARVIADYVPESRAVRESGAIRLREVTSGRARDWFREASQCVSGMMKLWNELGN
jgi:hypothetical protein